MTSLLRGSLLHPGKGVAKVEGDVQCTVLVDGDPVDQLGQDGAGKALDIAVLFEMLDEIGYQKSEV